ncbi:Uncharacterised protein [Vibrio cholerae]|nr:Uncharacterised protein [Vibrio cholerae]
MTWLIIYNVVWYRGSFQRRSNKLSNRESIVA